MITRAVFAGFGGQGVLLMGYVLSHGAMLKGLHVTYLPAYGTEMRGGTANCTVTVSDREISSPVASHPDILVAMNYPSLQRFEPAVTPGGLVLLNDSLIKEPVLRQDLRVIRVPLVELAREAGSERSANMVMTGVLMKLSGLLDIEETVKGMEASLKGKEKFFPLNAAGIAKGFEYAGSLTLQQAPVVAGNSVK